MTSVIYIPELAAFFKVCSLGDYILSPSETVTEHHDPIKALKIPKIKQNKAI